MFVNSNTSDRIKNANQVRQLRFEAKQREIARRGISNSNALEDILKTMNSIVRKDMKERQVRNESESKLLPGIVRRMSFTPAPSHDTKSLPTIAPDIILHERKMCAFLAELSERHPIVVSVDSTGGMINFKDTDFDGKMLHTLMMLHYKESVLTKKERNVTLPGDFSSTCLSERASSWNTASGVTSWAKAFIADVEAASLDVFGRSIKPSIGLVRSDNALQFPTGFIEAFREDNHIDSARGYNNIVLALLLRHEDSVATLDPSSDAYVSDCVFVMCTLKKHSPFAWVTCNVHTYLYRRDGYKNMVRKPPQLKSYYTQINCLYRNSAYGFFREKSVALLIIRMSILVVIFESEFVPSGNISLGASVREGHDAKIAERMAKNMSKLAVKIATSLSKSITNERVEEVIAGEYSQVGFPSKQRFKGSSIIAGSAIEMLRESLKFSISYPTSIDPKRKECTVRTAIMYSPFGLKLDGSFDNVVEAKLVGGFETVVKVPYRGKNIANPLYSMELAKYWRRQIDRVGLTSHAITTVAGAAWDRSIYESNMSLEAYINEINNRNKRSRESIANVPTWMVSRYEEWQENMALVRTQIVSHPQKMRKRSSRKVSRNDELREEDREAIWQKGNTGVTLPLELSWEKLMTSLKAAMREEQDSEDWEKYQYQRSNVLSIYRVLQHVSTKLDGEILCQFDFYEWHNRERTTMLPMDFITLIEELHQKYVVSEQRYGVGTEVSKVFFKDGTNIEERYSGMIISYNMSNKVYLVKYSDGDEEEYTEEEVTAIVIRS